MFYTVQKYKLLHFSFNFGQKPHIKLHILNHGTLKWMSVSSNIKYD